MSHLPFILACLLLLGLALLSAVISALETALLSLKEHHVAVIGENRPELTGMMRAIARQPRRSIHQVVLLGSVLNLALAVAGLLVLREFGPLIPGRPLASAILLLGILVVVGELFPTLAALAAPAHVFRILVTPFIASSPALEKISAKLESITDRLSDWIIPSGLKPHENLNDDEIETLIEMRREQGTLGGSESEIIQEIIRLGNKTAKDCMTPRVDSLMVDHSLSDEALLGELRAADKWHWLVPVYQGSPDVVVGILDVKSWLYHPGGSLEEFVKPPVFVPETMNALEAFRDYLRAPRSLCVVLDEYGGVEGVLSHSDIVEEILADAAPAFDHVDEIEILIPGKHLRADGDARLDDIGDALDLDLTHEGLDTIGGLVFNELGHLPRPGTAVIIAEVVRVTIRRSQRQRITGVEIERLLPPSP